MKTRAIKTSFLLFLLLISFSSVQVRAGILSAPPVVSESDALTFTPITDSPNVQTTAATTVQKSSVQEKAAPLAKPAQGTVHLSLITIFLTGFLGGLAAILLPCIFPMLPLTVGYFTKRHKDKGKGIRDAAVYGLSIILIYVGLGMLITVIFGADALNALSTNGIFNFVFFVLLVVFASSFFGAFEIVLPNKWVNKAEENTERKGFTGIFFMAAALALVSFSCTGPIIGTLLVQAATSGARLGPAIGMFGFSFALALPFVLFALFPSWLNGLPKSGGWLNSVKVCLGFLELALSLKFLSNVDLTYHWHLFDREVFLVLWIVIAVLAGIYLLGKLKFSHDSDVNYISVPRLFLAIITLSFAVYMVPGLWGAPLKSISAFLPPQSSQDFDLYTPTLSAGNNMQFSNESASTRVPHKYNKLFDKPLNLDPFFDYKEGLAYANKVHKPVLIDFTGHACVNCRKMEAAVWPDKQVLPLLKDSYVLIQLYVDDKTPLPEHEQYISTLSKRKITTIGQLNNDIQATHFNTNSQPFYVLLNPADQSLLVQPKGADYDPSSYYHYLKSGLEAFNR